jgi:DNA-3-methyladenine glycosylase II
VLTCACCSLAIPLRLPARVEAHPTPALIPSQAFPTPLALLQQLATTAAAKIYGRVLTTCGCSELLTPEALLAASMADLRAAGLSERKVSYLKDLAQHFSDGRLSDDKIAAMDEATLERALCAVKGIGMWTCHMHAMFHLGSPDVLPVGDLGVRKGMQTLYGLKELPSPDTMHRIAEKWRPFASLGSYYMWKAPVEKASSSKAKKSKKG